jgi:D-ribose pyranase
MIRNPIFNSDLNAALSRLGAGDRFAVISARHPVPEGVELIDLALCAGVPDFKTIYTLMMDQVEIDQITRTEELEKTAPDIKTMVEDKAAEAGAKMEALTYRQFKILAKTARFAVRVGETEVQASVVLRVREV